MKAVIPVLSSGTGSIDTDDQHARPVFVRPAVHAAVEEALMARCDEIVIVSDAGDGPGFEAAGWHHHAGADGPAKVRLVRHGRPVNIGRAVLAAAPYLDDAPFMVITADDIGQTGEPSMRELLEIHHETAGAVLAVRPVEHGDTARLGAVDVGHGGGRLHPVVDLFETPLPPHVLTQRAILGRLILTQEIAQALLTSKDGDAPETILMAAMKKAVRESAVYAVEPITSVQPLTSRAAARAARGLGMSGHHKIPASLVASAGL